MKNIRLSLFVAMLMSIFVTKAQTADDKLTTSMSTEQRNIATDTTHFDSGVPMSVGLVLSGGGAKGIAHVGVIKALEENNIPIDYVAGTSMGAIIGGLYAMGYTPDEMLDLILSPEFTNWSTGQFDPAGVYYFSRSEPTPAMFNFPINKRENQNDSVPASIISPLPMNFGFMEVFSAYTAQCGGDFDKLFVPFRCVASDVEAGHKVVHRSGSLGDAIRSSMSFPIVFQPIRINGRILYDGGIFDNFPVDVMTNDFSPDIMIGVDVSTPVKGPQTSLMDQVDNLVMHHQDYSLDPRLGIKIKVDLHQFALLDFPEARKISQIGYDKTMSMIDSIKARVTSRISPQARMTARGAFKSHTPYLTFDSVYVSGATAHQNEYISYLFKPANHTDTFGIDHARESFYRAVSPGRLKDLSPCAVYNDSTRRFTLDLKASVKDNLNVSVGGYITSSTNSYLYGSIGYKVMNFSSLGASLGVWIGQSYLGARLDGSVNLRTAIPSAVSLTAVASRQRFYESDRMFYQTNVPTFVIDNEYYGRLSFDVAVGRRGKLSTGVGLGHIYDSFYRTVEAQTFLVGRDNTRYNLGQALVRYTSSTLDNNQFPTKGHAYNWCGMGVLGSYHFTPADTYMATDEQNVRWLQLELRSRNYFDLHKHFSLGVETDVMLSTRKLASTYNASIVNAPAYIPTNASNNVFNPALRANSFVAAGIIPIYKYSSALTARLMVDCFMPLRRIEVGDNLSAKHGKWFSNPEFFSELDISYSFPFATLSGYVNYVTTGSRHWNAGLTLGIFLLAPKFLR